MGGVSSFGKDAVVIASSSSIIPASSDPELRDLVEREDRILGKAVYTTTGDEQGSIADIYFAAVSAAGIVKPPTPRGAPGTAWSP